MPEGKSHTTQPWADPGHPGNRIRWRIRCLGCRQMGCTTSWGPWCFKCNVARMTRLSASFTDIAKSYGIENHD